ncbi:MAG: membrane protein insertion efficiency factor YidD [Patescibacteria group bacterium]|nr:membrane protein insertion efficiency factor YidD [Patescibacteria group bacterium]
MTLVSCQLLVLLPRRTVCGLIWLYQRTLSLDHGPLHKYVRVGACRYYPTCSQYGYEAIMKYGVFRGVPMTIWRILRCNPWSRGGIDPVK